MCDHAVGIYIDRYNLTLKLTQSERIGTKIVILEARDFCSGATARNGTCVIEELNGRPDQSHM